MRVPNSYSLFLVVCLVAGALLAPTAPAQSTSPQTDAPIIAAPISAKQWTGDLDALLQHTVIRIAVPYSKRSITK